MEKQSLFHIPFKKRYKVARQRYSIPGLPCLYLGGTLYICWLEMKRPNFDSLFISRFRVASGAPVSFLDLGMRPKNIANHVANLHSEGGSITALNLEDDRIIAYAVCWPLIAASSIQARYPDEPFIPEYIIPQLLLQWVTTSKDLDGICYFSVKTNAISDPAHGTANFVFPTKSDLGDGYCPSLLSKFEMSDPISWQILEANDNIYGASESVNADMTIDLIPNRPMSYRHSNFYDIERKMLRQECTKFIPPP